MKTKKASSCDHHRLYYIIYDFRLQNFFQKSSFKQICISKRFDTDQLHLRLTATKTTFIPIVSFSNKKTKKMYLDIYIYMYTDIDVGRLHQLEQGQLRLPEQG